MVMHACVSGLLQETNLINVAEVKVLLAMKKILIEKKINSRHSIQAVVIPVQNIFLQISISGAIASVLQLLSALCIGTHRLISFVQ